MSMIFRRIRVVLAALIVVPLVRADGPAPKGVPFEMLPSNHMVVEAKLDGKGPYRLIFDLGSPVTLLSNEAAEKSGAIDPKSAKSFLFGARGEGTVKRLEVGELQAENVPVIVLDHPALKALGRVLGKPIDGIMGYTFFAHYRTTIDYQTKRMTFVPVDFQVKDLMKSLPAQLTAGPKAAAVRVLAPAGLWGMTLDEPAGGLDAPGVPVRAVLAGSPAESAGLKPGDVLTTLDGRWTANVADAYAAASGVEPGREAEVVVLRDGAETTLRVRPKPGL